MKYRGAHCVIEASLAVTVAMWDRNTRERHARIRKRVASSGQRNLHRRSRANRLRLVLQERYVRRWHLQRLNAIGIAHQENQIAWPDYALYKHAGCIRLKRQRARRARTGIKQNADIQRHIRM